MFADAADVDVEKLSRDSKLRSTGEIDSLSLGEFYCEVEEHWSINIPDRLCSAFYTIGDVIDHVESKVAL